MAGTADGRQSVTAPIAAFEEALLEHLHAALDSLSGTVVGLTAAQLMTVPAADANSVAVLVGHTVETARSIARDLAGDPIPRDREAPFRIVDTSEAELRQLIDDCSSELDALVRQAVSRPLDARLTRYREASHAWWLLQVLGHTREHAAHASLTRQLVLERGADLPVD